jgi:acyl carrier protein
MTEAQILARLLPLVTEVTAAPAEKIRPDSSIVRDLGADSIDLLDLTFLIEEKFGITIQPGEFEKQVRARTPGGVYEEDGVLTDAALGELRRMLPELREDALPSGLRKADLPSRLTVAVFVHLIQRKLNHADAAV